MRIDRRPLLDTTVDADLFVGRDAELQRLLRAVDLDLNAAVTGAHGLGRTSLLRRLMWCLRQRESGVEVLLLSTADVEDAAAFLLRLYRRLAGDEAAAVARLAGLDVHGLLERISQATAGRPSRTVVVLDDLSVSVGRAVFGGLRDEIWRLELAWVVGVEEEARDALLSAPVDVFFEVIVPLPPLSTKEAVALVRHRVGEKSPLNKSEITDLVRLGEGHPRRLVDLVRAVLLDGTTVDGLAERLRSRGSRLQHVSRPAASLAAELEALGPMSPSDTELQERMGVSRPRLVTLFSELRDAGLVREAAPARDGSRPGRPRVRYVLTDSPGRPVGTDASDGSPESSGQCVGGLRDPAEDER